MNKGLVAVLAVAGIAVGAGAGYWFGQQRAPVAAGAQGPAKGGALPGGKGGGGPGAMGLAPVVEVVKVATAPSRLTKVSCS